MYNDVIDMILLLRMLKAWGVGGTRLNLDFITIIIFLRMIFIFFFLIWRLGKAFTPPFFWGGGGGGVCLLFLIACDFVYFFFFFFFSFKLHFENLESRYSLYPTRVKCSYAWSKTLY